MRLLCEEVTELFCKKLQVSRWIIENYSQYNNEHNHWDDECYEYNSAYKLASDGEGENYNPKDLMREMGVFEFPEIPDIVRIYEENVSELISLNREINQLSGCCSLFHDFIFTSDQNLRKYVKDHWQRLYYYYKNIEVYCADIWTQGIYQELFNEKFDSKKLQKYWAQYLELPERLISLLK